MNFIGIDLEGVLIPEIWVSLAEKTGINELKLTTKDISDYKELMKIRINILKKKQMKSNLLFEIASEIKPYEGAIEFLSEITSVNVIPSRRTPSEFIKNLSMLKNHKIKLFTDLFDPVTYGNLLSESNMQIVTWDSISMISEAISSETGTFLYEFEEESCPKRYQLFHQMVKQKGFIKSFSRNMESYTVSMSSYNSELKSKILNKIESNLWFKNSVS